MSRNIFIIIAASIDEMYQFLFPESIGWGDTIKKKHLCHFINTNVEMIGVVLTDLIFMESSVLFPFTKHLSSE